MQSKNTSTKTANASTQYPKANPSEHTNNTNETIEEKVGWGNNRAEAELNASSRLVTEILILEFGNTVLQYYKKKIY